MLYAAESQVALINGRSFFTRERLAYLAVLVLAGAVYTPALSGTLIWDDAMLVGGQGIGGGQSLARCFTAPFLNLYFRPLVGMSFFAERRLWGDNPFLYHQTNLLL